MPKKDSSGNIIQRKKDHLEICCNNTNDILMDQTTGFEDIQFLHNALPGINFDDINISSDFLDYHFKAPIFISSMTGGTASTKINSVLAKITAKYEIGIGVGSQRAAIENPSYSESFKIIRKYAKENFVAANIGAIQLNNDFTVKQVGEALKMVDGDALILHLNPLQEVIQPEGDTNYKNLLDKIRKLITEIDKPVIVKEVGSGISSKTAQELIECKISAIDIAGAGGTSWAQIEAIRAEKQGLEKLSRVGKLFKNWGIPTASNLISISELSNQIELIASGGVRNGLEAAKAFALGAKLVGIGLPLGCLAHTSTEKQLIDWLEQFIYELKTTMFLVGAQSLEELQEKPLTITGKTADWLKARGYGGKLKELHTRG